MIGRRELFGATAGALVMAQTLKADAALPVGMAIIYLLLIFYFKAIGGYRPITIAEGKSA